MSTEPMQVVVRALDVLRALADAHEGKSLQQLHLDLEIPVASMYRLLGTLTHTGFATRSTMSGRYYLGSEARNLATPPASIASQLVTPPPALAQAATESGETVFLTELIGEVPVCVSLVEARQHALRLFVHIGQEMPLHAAASSRAILAYQADAKVRSMLGAADLKSFTDGTPRTMSQVLHHLESVRERGYDVCEDELDNDVWAIAAPVRSPDGNVTSSVTLAAAGTRMQDDILKEHARETILRAAAALSTQLGAAADEAATE